MDEEPGLSIPKNSLSLFSGIAVIVSEVSDAIEPPLLSTEPPCEVETSTLKKIVGIGVTVSSSNESLSHVVRRNKENKKIDNFFRM